MTGFRIQDHLSQLSIPYQEHPRLGVMVAGMAVHRIVLHHPVNFVRRRYSDRTFTWAEVFRKESSQWVSLGDPWPCLTPAKKELADAVWRVIKQPETESVVST